MTLEKLFQAGYEDTSDILRLSELPSYPGLYINDSKLCFCRHPISISLLHLRWHWQPYTQGGRREGARVRQDEGHHRENGRSSLLELKTRHWPGARGREGLEKMQFWNLGVERSDFLVGIAFCAKYPKKEKQFFQRILLKAQHVIIDAFCPELHFHFKSNPTSCKNIFQTLPCQPFAAVIFEIVIW